MRFEDWFERLAKVIAEHEAMNFEYGASDCACFVDDCIKATTGKSIYSDRAKDKDGIFAGLKNLENIIREK